ncbi:MAG: exodeoxyribonuclease VII large subunit [Vulcanimicrobiaceae bacterium]
MQETLFSAQRVEGVSRVVSYIGKMLKQSKTLTGISVRGEVSNFRKLQNGRLYFDLKEGRDVLACVAWESRALELPEIKNGDELIASGEFGIYADQSKYQLIVTAARPSGIGNLHAQLEAMRERFRTEGLFDPERKRAMPLCPMHVALVSARAKGAEDFFETAARRAPHLQITLVETRVQGVGAEIDIAEAIDRASRMPVDAVVVARGGGSFEDRFPFNLEPVVRAIVRCARPVMTAIGHAGDRHLADEVADYSAETPSNAAQYFGEARDALIARVQRLRDAIAQHARAVLFSKAQRLDAALGQVQRGARAVAGAQERRFLLLRHRLDNQRPSERIAERENRLARATARLSASSRSALVRYSNRTQGVTRRFMLCGSKGTAPFSQRFERVFAKLAIVDPDRELQRGFALVTRDGKVLRHASDASAGDLITARLMHGTLDARVERVNSNG